MPPDPTHEDPRRRGLESDVLHYLVRSQFLQEKDVDSALAALSKSDHVAEELIRTIAEKFFPGHIDMKLKTKVIGTLLVFYEIAGEVPVVLAEMSVDTLLKEIDSLGEQLLSSDGDEDLPPSTE